MFVCIWKQVRRALLCDRCRGFFDYSPHRDMLKCNADITIPKLNVIIVYHNSNLHVLMSAEKMCMWDILFPRILTEPIKQTTRWAWRKVCVTTGCVSSWPDVLTYKHIYYQLSNARISSHQWLCKCCLKKVKKEMTLHFANSWHKNKRQTSTAGIGLNLWLIVMKKSNRIMALGQRCVLKIESHAGFYLIIVKMCRFCSYHKTIITRKKRNITHVLLHLCPCNVLTFNKFFYYYLIWRYEICLFLDSISMRA